MICTHQIHSGDKIKDYEMEKYGMYGEEEYLQGFGGETLRKETTWKN